ncbi:MAG: sigma-54 dependent transcriptional regulator [Deltaproteobacteria bacterium]|nr:sigma-54 dependent transcriptional regulator [Deltaproteobacteria bacterium]
MSQEPVSQPPTPSRSILAIDDEVTALKGIRRTLRAHGHKQVLTCADGRQALDLMAKNPIALVLLDLVMPHINGEQILEEAGEKFPEVPVVVITAQHDVRTAVACMKLGAADYLLKPVAAEELISTVDQVLEQSALRYEARRLREDFFGETLREPKAFAQIITEDPGMLRVFAYLEAISRGTQPVLISGETGTGKELLAQALHQVSLCEGPFMGVNVAGLDDAMFSDTLFGHRAGAFTGAAGNRKGMIEKAEGGTLFLDEIGDLSEASQVKLLRLIQEREFYPLGSDSPRPLRARVVAATHRAASALRQDLYFRLRSYRVRLPPLRQRLGDLPALVERFAKAAAEDLGRPEPEVPPELFVHLSRYHFPGNVRELQAMVFDAVARQQTGQLPLQPFLESMAEQPPPKDFASAGNGEENIDFPFPLPSMKQITQSAIQEALRRAQGSSSTAAEMLALSEIDDSKATVSIPGPTDRIIQRHQWKVLERQNILRALGQADWRIAGKDGAAELLGMRPSTLESRIKALEIRKG